MSSVTLPWGPPSTASTSTTSASSLFAIHTAQFAPTFPAPTTVTFLRRQPPDRKSSRLNSSHLGSWHAVFCFKKKINHSLDVDRQVPPLTVRRLQGRRPPS